MVEAVSNVAITVQNSEDKSKSTLERIIIEAFKQQCSKDICANLSVVLEQMKSIIEEAKGKGSFILTRNIVDKTSRLRERKYFSVNILLANIFDTLLDSNNFQNLSNDINLLIQLFNEMLILLDGIKSSIISSRLEKKCTSFLRYLLVTSKEHGMLNDEQQGILDEIFKSFPTRNSSEIYKNFASTAKDKIIKLCRSQKAEEKMEGLNILMASFGSTATLEEQFDMMNEHCSEIFKGIIYLPNLDCKEIYFQLGNFICTMLYATKYKIDSFIAEYKIQDNEDNRKYFYLVINDEVVNEYLKDNTNFLHNTFYELTNQKEILAKYEHITTLCSLIINTLANYESVFDLQFVAYVILKRIYFSFPESRKSFEDVLIIILVNICSFQSKAERENNEECRDFLSYLLTHGDDELKSKLTERIEIKAVADLCQPDAPLEDVKEAEYEILRIADFNLKIGYPNYFEVDAGVQVEQFIEVLHPYSLVYVGFATQANDISVKLLKYAPDYEVITSKEAEDENYDEENENDNLYIPDQYHFAKVLNIDKIDCSVQPVRIVLFAEVPGTYKVVFDNSYSWMTAKILRFRISVLKQICEIDLNHPNVQLNSPHTQCKKVYSNEEVQESKTLNVKYAGKNRRYNCEELMLKIQKFSNNKKYVTIPVLLTCNSLRVKAHDGFKDLIGNDEPNVNIPAIFEQKMEEYINSLIHLTEEHTIFLNIFLLEKDFPQTLHSQSTTNIPVTNDNFYNYIYDKLGFYPENLLNEYHSVLNFFIYNLSDSFLLYFLFLKTINDEKCKTMIHIHLDKYKAQASLYSDGVIHEKISGLKYDLDKNFLENIDNVMEFVRMVAILFGGFNLSFSFSEINITGIAEFYECMSGKLESMETRVVLEKYRENCLEDVLQLIQIFHMND